MYEFPKVSDLNSVSPQKYVQAEKYIMDLLSKEFPDKSFSIGSTLYWHIVVPAAAAMAAVQDNADRIGNSMSLRWLRDSETVDEELAKALLANYYQKVPDGTYASGYIAVIVNVNAAFSIPEGAVFESDTMTYIATQQIFAVPDARAVSDTGVDRVLEERPDGTWSVLVPIKATEKGVVGALPSGTLLRMRNPPAGFVAAVTATSISGGEDPVSYKDVLLRASESFAPQTYGSDAHLTAIIRSVFPSAQVSVVGMGDKEMLRDRVNPLGISTGGMIDVYVAPQTTLASKTIRASATSLGTANNITRLRIQLNQSDCYGLYPASIKLYFPGTRKLITDNILIFDAFANTNANILLEDPGSYTDELNVGTIGTIFSPIPSGSAYQNIVIMAFIDRMSSLYNLNLDSVTHVDIEALYMPYVKEVQELLSSPQYKSSAVSTIVYGAVPCVVTAHVQVRLLDGDVFSDDELMIVKQRIVQAVSKKGFRYGVLSSSHIIDIVHDYIDGRSDVASYSVFMKGEIYGGGELASKAKPYVIEGQELTIPDVPEYFISKNTTMFFTDTTRIHISCESVRT